MKAHAIARFVRISPYKARLVADLIRGKSVEEAIAILKYSPKRAARIIEKLLKSAISNAENKEANVENLVIDTITVDEGPRLKRYRPRAMGRATLILHRTSHIKVVVDDGEEPGEEE